MMKARTGIIVAMAICLLLGSIALRQDFYRLSLTGQGSALAQSNVSALPVQYIVTQGVASGGGYNLTGLAWKVSGTSSGGEYRLLGPASPAGGTQCCCLYLPCLLRN